MNVLILIAGLVLLVAGATWLTDGASGIARRWGISEFIIGLTIVAIGTSMPEFIVSVFSASAGHSDMAVGNVVGSNLFNTLVILGITALIMPLPLSSANLRKDIPFGVLASCVLLLVAFNFRTGMLDEISRAEGVMMLLLFAAFLYYTASAARKDMKVLNIKEKKEVGGKEKKIWLLIVMIVAGLCCLVVGGNFVLDSATAIAHTLGVSEAVIAVTLMAGGTSLPELAASVAAAVKRKPGLALGNVIGSNIANIFFVLGASATISPLRMGDIVTGDILAVIASSLLLLVAAFTFKKKILDRWEAVIFLLLYGFYMWWLLTR